MSDRAGKGYWDGVWADVAVPTPVDHTDPHFRNRVNRVFAAFFDRALNGLAPGSWLLEVGCARSEWLPYFARRYPMTVTGLDYSEDGCALEREVLRRAGVDGDVLHSDLFTPPPESLEAFDAVVSLGVVEHFDDTAACIEAIARLAKPGGVVITVIPNMAGAQGLLQRVANPSVFDIHVPLTASNLANAHRRAGLAVEESKYLLSTNFGVVNLHGRKKTTGTRLLERLLLQLTRISKLAWIFEDRFGPLPATRTFAPYVGCWARRPV